MGGGIQIETSPGGEVGLRRPVDRVSALRGAPSQGIESRGRALLPPQGGRPGLDLRTPGLPEGPRDPPYEGDALHEVGGRPLRGQLERAPSDEAFETRILDPMTPEGLRQDGDLSGRELGVLPRELDPEPQGPPAKISASLRRIRSVWLPSQ